MTLKILYLTLLLFLIHHKLKQINASHFRGGTISWSPVNPNTTTTPIPAYIEVAITTRFFWAISTATACDSTPEIAAHALIGDSTSITPLTGHASWSIKSILSMLLCLFVIYF